MSSRRLWLDTGEAVVLQTKQTKESYDEIFERFSKRQETSSLFVMISSSFVVGQEFILTCLFLAAHRTVSSKGPSEDFDRVAQMMQPSLILVWLAFFLVILHNKPTDSDAVRARKMKIRHRSADGLFMAALLRFLAAVLKTLTASYSTDTVHALAISGFVLHLLACDYSYANGMVRAGSLVTVDTMKRPAFQGGTLSLTAAFFATTLLASRLETNLMVYIFVSSSVVLFALYPAARHQVAINTRTNNKWVPAVISVLLAGATFQLLSGVEIASVLAILMLCCGVVPLWKFFLQRYKVILVGPWVLVHPTTDRVAELHQDSKKDR